MWEEACSITQKFCKEKLSRPKLFSELEQLSYYEIGYEYILNEQNKWR